MGYEQRFHGFGGLDQLLITTLLVELVVHFVRLDHVPMVFEMMGHHWQQLCRKYCKKESRLTESWRHSCPWPVVGSSCSQKWDPEGNYCWTRGNLFDCNTPDDMVEYECGGIIGVRIERKSWLIVVRQLVSKGGFVK